MQCLDCSHEWSATPLSKAQTWIKNGVNGCPECHKKRKRDKRSDWNVILDAMPHIHVDRDLLSTMTRTAASKIEVTNIVCGHTFMMSVTNLLSQGVECTTCNTERKREAFRQRNRALTLPPEEIKTWRRWKAVVVRRSHANAPPIPEGAVCGLAGVEGAWHLDHIYPMRKAYNEGWSVDKASSPENLQWLPWRDNIIKRDRT